MIRLKKIILHNFGSYEDTELEFSNDITLVLGENNDSTITKSMGAGKSYLFLAITYALYGRTNRHTLKRYGTDNSYVELYYNNGKDRIRLKRYCNDIRYSNRIEMSINDEELHLHTINEYQKVINSIVKLSYEHFISSVVITQGLPTSILQMSPTKRNDYFISLLPIDFNKIIKLIKKDVISLTDKINRIKINITKLKLQESKLKGYMEAYKNINIERDKLDKYKSDYANIIELINSNTEIIKKGKTDLQKLEIEYTSSNKVVKLLNELVTSGKCPICKHKASGSQKKDYDKYIKQADKSNKAIFKLTKSVKDIKKSNVELLSKSEQLYYKIKEIAKYDDIINSNIDKDIERLQKTINQMEDGLDFIQDDYTKLTELQSLLLPSGEVRSVLIARYVYVFNDILKSVSKLIWTDKFECSAKLDSEGLKFVTNKPFSLSGGEFRLFNVIVQLSFVEFINLLNNTRINLLVLDETFDGFDYQAVENMIEYFKTQLDDVAVYVITHENSVKSMFETTLTVKKKKGISYL